MREAIKSATLMLAPVTPHVCHEIWRALHGDDQPVVDASWPQVDESALLQPSGAGKDDCEAMALADENILRHTEGKTIRKVIVVPEKLVNIVVS